MRAVTVERHLHRFAAARAASALTGSAAALGLGPLRLLERDPLRLPGPDWYRVRPLLAGICGSDLATVEGRSSRFFEPIVSFPFVLGHEIVGEVTSGDLEGTRVVVEPVLGCEARGITPLCAACARGRKGACERIAHGDLEPGLQTGFCATTGGGWSEELVCHRSQLHLVPETLTDDEAVMVEPTACGIHAALAVPLGPRDEVVVLGAGTLGLTTLAALRAYADPGEVLVVARYPVQRDAARRLGADVVSGAADLTRTVRRLAGTLALADDDGKIERLTGGADVVFDCVGSSASIAEALRVVRPGGKIVMVGMPGTVHVDLAPLWQREVSLVGAYAYGTEERPDGPYATFELALELVAGAHLGELVSARYPLERYEEAIRHAAHAGRRGAIKVVFDLREAPVSWRRRPTNEEAPAGADDEKEPT